MGAGFRETTQEMVQYSRASTRREPSPLDLEGMVYGNQKESCMGRAMRQQL